MKTERMQKILDKVCGADACPSDVALLFLWLRDFSKTQKDSDGKLWDLACYISHNQERNQGVSHKKIQTVLKNLIEVSKEGGSFGMGQPIFSSNEVVDMLIIKLKSDIKLKVDENIIKSKQDFICCSLQELIEGTEFIELKLPKPEFVSCCLVRDGNKISYEVRLNLPNRLFSVDPSARILFPLFD